MAAIVGALRAILSLESAAFNRGLSQAQKRMGDFQKRMEKWGGGLQRAGAALSVAGTGIALAIRRQVNAADELGKAAQKFGLPVETLSKLAYAAELSDVSLETLGSNVGRLSRLMDAAAKGNKGAQETFTSLGVAVTNANGKLRPTEDVLADISQVFADMPDGAEKTALAMRVFGKAGADMIPMLNAGRDGLQEMMEEAQRFGLVIDADTAKAAENFNDNLTRLTSALKGLTIQIMASLAPAMEWLSEKAVALAGWFGQLSPKTREWMAVIAAATVAMGPALIALGLAVSSVGALTGAFTSLAAIVMGHPIVAAIAAIAAGALLIWQNWEPIKVFFTDLWVSVKASAESAWLSIKSGADAAVQWVKDSWNGMIQFFEDLFMQIPEILDRVWEAIKAKLGAWVEGFKQVGRDMMAGLTSALVDPGPPQTAIYDAMGNVVGTAEDALEIKSPSRVFARIGEFIMAGLGMGITNGSGIANSAMGTAVEGLTQQTAGLSEGMQSFQSAAKSAFEGLVTGSMSGKEALKGLLEQIAQIAAQKAAMGLFGGADGGGLLGGLLGGLGSFFGFAKGGAFANGRVQAFASGGIVNRATAFGMAGGGMGVMGEAGPEAIMPLTRGKGGKLGVVAQGGGADIRITLGDGLQGEILSKAQQNTVKIVQGYDRQLPNRFSQVSNDRRRR